MSAPVPEQVDERTVRLPSGELLRICDFPDCEQTFVLSPRGFGPKRKRCDEHLNKTPPGSHRKKERAPTSINFNLPKAPGKKDPALEAVERRAMWLAGMVSVAVLFLGQPEDAADIERGRELWAKSVGELAEYEPWLKKLAAGGEGSARVMAWVKVGTATGAMLLPIFLRHDALPAFLANLFRQMEQTPQADVMGQVFQAMNERPPGEPADAPAA